MDFFNFYQNIPNKTEKRKLRNKIVDVCSIQQSTFYYWLSKRSVPALAKQKICELLNLPEEELFPIEENENLIIN